MTEVLAQFQGDEATADSGSALAFLDRLENSDQLTRLRERTYALIRDMTGAPGAVAPPRGVDVGCGAGRAVAELRGRGLQATGVDRSDLMLQAARGRHPHLPFLEAGAEDLPFEDHSLDWYRAERLYLHLPDPAAALAEARRVLAPGGAIVLIDPICDSGAVDSAYPEVTRAIGDALVQACPNARAATRNHADLAAAGFGEITPHCHTIMATELAEAAPLLVDLGLATATGLDLVGPAQAAEWLDDLRRRDAAGRMLAVMTFTITVARAPAA
ncbi:methyltransferase domain-containing protein [Spirillospora sp. NPDC029432]|uniref:methyltransferase domain-containing protein n=1 Tax=Spirillospora sp. NPDC029432 TaxID=3154599 RepID=UPI0034544414